MKDLEKIKSEDLAAQVQDANPANFAIEQEVAQLVGATVPQPTEPSADDARELGAQLLVFLRRALTPIQLALRTALAAIYAHLDSRCTAYTPAGYDPFRLPAGPYDPMRPFVPRTLPNLLTALTAFSDRKISEPNAIDGISLAHILCGTTETEEIYDNNSGWTMMRSLPTIPGLKKATIGCKSMPVNCGFTQAEEYVFPNLEALDNRASGWGGSTNVFGGGNIKKIVLPALKTLHCNNMNGSGFFYSLTSPCEIIMENCEYVYSWAANSYPMTFRNCSGVTKLVFGKLTTATNLITEGFTNLIHLEIGQDTAINLDLRYWNPTNVLSDADKTATFLLNFREHIALRLTANGSGKTLTLSQAVFSAVIEGSSPICDDIKGIIEDKGWKVQDTNNNIFPTT